MNTTPLRTIHLRQITGLILGLAAFGPASAQTRTRDEQPGATQNRAPLVERTQPAPARTVDRPHVEPQPGRTDQTGLPRPTPRTGPKGTPPPKAAPPEKVATVKPRTQPPTQELWQNRDIFAEIQAMARRGVIPVDPIGEDIDDFTGVSEFPTGWKAYGFRVPAGENLHVRLNHTNEGWFRLMMVGTWGRIERGMLQNLIPTGNPEVSYTNLTGQPHTVYVIVDDPGLWASTNNPFGMKVKRSWNPDRKKIEGTPFTTGIWAQKEVKVQDPSLAQVRTVEQPKG